MLAATLQESQRPWRSIRIRIVQRTLPITATPAMVWPLLMQQRQGSMASWLVLGGGVAGLGAAPAGRVGSDRSSNHELSGFGAAVDHGVKVFALTTGASAEAFPDSAVEALAGDVGAEVAELGGVFGEGEGAAVDGGSHVSGWW